MIKSIYDFRQHHRDKRPINILGLGENVFSQIPKTERWLADVTCIVYVADGGGVLEIASKAYELTAGDVFLLRRGTQCLYYTKQRHKAHTFFVALGGSLPEILLDHYLPDQYFVFNNCNAEGWFKSAFEKAEQCQNDYEMLLDELSPEVIRLMNIIAKCPSHEMIDPVERIRVYLDSHNDKPFSLDILAANLGYSKNHVINLFRERYNISPYKYYTAKRLETAKHYLLETDYSLTEISKKMSFSNQQYFSAWFKSLCGVSLTEFRNQKK